MQYFDATTEAVLVQIAFVVVAIVVAWVVLSLLKGTAQVQQKGVQFGGAAAMFVATFFLINKYVYPVHVTTRKSFGLMTRKLSVTRSRHLRQFLGILSRKKSSVASANCPHVA